MIMATVILMTTQICISTTVTDFTQRRTVRNVKNTLRSTTRHTKNTKKPTRKSIELKGATTGAKKRPNGKQQMLPHLPHKLLLRKEKVCSKVLNTSFIWSIHK